jgi:hypothetical protein
MVSALCAALARQIFPMAMCDPTNSGACSLCAENLRLSYLRMLMLRPRQAEGATKKMNSSVQLPPRAHNSASSDSVCWT